MLIVCNVPESGGCVGVDYGRPVCDQEVQDRVM